MTDICAPTTPPSPRQDSHGGLFAGAVAAILASTCCLGPLLLVALGFSGAWIDNLTALKPYRPISGAAALLAMLLRIGVFSELPLIITHIRQLDP